jgi:hypothetical protein
MEFLPLTVAADPFAGQIAANSPSTAFAIRKQAASETGKVP